MNDVIRDVSSEDPLIRVIYGAGRVFSRYFDTKLIDVERVPDEGAVMLVGNHALMGIDSWALLPELFRHTERIPRGMALRTLFDMPLLADFLSSVGMVRGERRSAIELLLRGEMVLTYPGGARDSLKGRSERYQLKWEGRHGFAHVAIASRAPIVPVVGVGPDDCFPILNDRGLIPTRGLGSTSLKLPLILPIARRVPFDFHFGAPIDPPEVAPDASPELMKEATCDHASDVRRATQALLDEAVEQRGEPERRSRLPFRRWKR